jgi:hypothetical protein
VDGIQTNAAENISVAKLIDARLPANHRKEETRLSNSYTLAGNQRAIPSDIMDSRVAILIGIAASLFAIPVLMHLYVKRYVLASALSAISVALLCSTALVWGRSFSFGMFATAFGAMLAASFIIALGIGIPFNRRRSPLPEEGTGNNRIQRHFTRRMSFIEVILALLFAVVFWRVFRGFTPLW